MDLLNLAFYLSVLSYCLGLLLKALPLPFISIKKLGRSLVADGLFSATLVFSYNLIFRLMEYLGRVLGSDWIAFGYWLTDRISMITNLLAVLKALGIALDKLGFRFITSVILTPITNLVTSSYMMLLFILVIATVLFTSFKLLMALGLVLHAVPFKLTRSVGSTILSFAIVFILGIPLMPAFSSLIISGVQPPLRYKEPVCTASLRLVDASRTSMGPAVIEGYDSRTGELLYKYKLNEQGELVVSAGLGFPCRNHTIVFDIANNTYIATFRRSNEEPINRTYQVVDGVFLAPNRFVFFSSNITILGVERTDRVVQVQLHTGVDGSIEIYTESEDGVTIYLNNTVIPSPSRRIGEWYGVWYSIYEISINPGTYNLTIVLDFYKTTPINVAIEPFILKAVEVDVFSPEALFVYAVYGFIELVLLPMIYMGILIAISISVARLLGGYSSTIMRLAAGNL
ncbi:MAG: hypothetical protein QW159_00145 [Desulfurococcaceae archaeon]